MELTKGRSVHPFFVREKDSNLAKPTIHLAPIPDQTPSSYIKAPIHSSRCDAHGSEGSTSDDHQCKSREGSLPSEMISMTPDGALNASSKESSTDRTATIAEDGTLLHIGHRTPLDNDGYSSDFPCFDITRRKRRRTASPTTTSLLSTDAITATFIQQLTAAAFGLHTPDSMEGEATGVPLSEQAMEDYPKDGVSRQAYTGGKDLDDIRSDILEEDIVADRLHMPTQKSTSNTRMLKLHAGGKLASPGTRTGPGISKSRAKRKVKGGGSVALQKIVVMKYGGESSSPQGTAEKIKDILEDKLIFERSSIKITEAPHEPKPKQPSKPMHPFFVSKANHSSEEDPFVKGDSVRLDVDGDKPKLESSMSPSQKPSSMSAKGADAWAKIGEISGRLGNAADTRVLKIPGSTEPLWPPRDMLHCRSLSSSATNNFYYRKSNLLPSYYKKHKGLETQISNQEEMLYAYQEHCSSLRTARIHGTMDIRILGTLRKPCRRLMTGKTLQDTLRSHIACRLPSNDETSQRIVSKQKEHLSPFASSTHVSSMTHNALADIFHKLPTSLTAFDRFQCETQDWVHKYAPRCAADVLQHGREALLLRDWLLNSAVTAVTIGNSNKSTTSEPSLFLRRSAVRLKRKRQKEGKLDGFIVSSDDEANDMDELTDPDETLPSHGNALLPKKSMIRTSDDPRLSGESSKLNNAVVISGPHGCGKTAAVYAVAQELGFEVFEINAGSRRSGKDLLDRVGDMTRNHLVHQTAETDKAQTDDVTCDDSIVKREIDMTRQRTVQSFFKQKPTSKQSSKPLPAASKLHSHHHQPPKEQKPRKQQQQSLILLDEVDILFEEDKQFWATTLGLIIQSKRPIVMTCTDESRLPIEEMVLHAIFRFSPPPEHIAVDYLILLAGNEGHIISRNAISALYAAKHADLRASISELNFWCQMAVGDRKGGVEWMLDRSNPQKSIDQGGEILRVVSDSTYLEGMGSLERINMDNKAMGSTATNLESSTQTLSDWELDMADLDRLIDLGDLFSPAYQPLSHQNLQTLKNFDLALDAISLADTFPGLGLRQDYTTWIDTTQPDFSEKTNLDYVEGVRLLQAEPVTDTTGLSSNLPLAVKACSWEVILHGRINNDLTSFSKGKAVRHNFHDAHPLPVGSEYIRSLIESALGPISEVPQNALTQSRGPQITNFDGPFTNIVEDIAPYVRSIVAYDRRLEEQRRRLNDLSTHAGRNGKKPRTTRASRAALEGGSKLHTRRDRWFSKKTNYALVMQTGGDGWQDLALQRQEDQSTDDDGGYNASRRSSAATTNSET